MYIRMHVCTYPRMENLKTICPGIIWCGRGGGGVSGSALFVIKYLNLYEQLGSSNLIDWKLEVGVASIVIQQGKG